MYDLFVIGAGPAGISAALTARNRGMNTAIASNPPETASLYKAERITNYPGFFGMSGAEIESRMRAELNDSGTQLIEGRVLSVMPMGDSFGIAVGGDYYEAKTVIIAAGMTREKLYPGEAEFLGRGVSYCATCDGMLYRKKDVAVIGNSKEAYDDADFLRDIGCNVTHFEKNGTYEIFGDMKLRGLRYAGEEYRLDGVFIIKDTVSVTQLVPGLEYSNGGIVTDRDMSTNIPGVFAAGDCTGKPYQLAKSVGEGNIAALTAYEYTKK